MLKVGGGERRGRGGREGEGEGEKGKGRERRKGKEAKLTVSNDCSLKPYMPPLLLLFIQLPRAKMTLERCKALFHST